MHAFHCRQHSLLIHQSHQGHPASGAQRAFHFHSRRCAFLSTNPIEAVPPQAHVVPSTVVGAASLSTNPAHPPPQKAKALPGPKTYENDGHISLRLNIAEQLQCSGFHLITTAPLRKQGKVYMSVPKLE